MTFVILTAGIDLSIGSLVAFAGLVAAAVAKGGLQDRFTVGEGGIDTECGGGTRGHRCRDSRWLSTGSGDHAPQGPAVCCDAWWHVSIPRRGFTICGGWADFRLSAGFYVVGSRQDWRGAGPCYHFLVAAVLAHIVLRYTRYGRQVYAVGETLKQRAFPG